MNFITVAMFVLILLVSLGITTWAARRTRTTSDFYAAGRGLTAAQNGFALAGDWCSAAAFLGFTGLTALYGMDGALYAVGPLVAFCTVLLLIAEPLRNTGTYTIGDVIMYRMRQPPALTAAIVGTIVINLAYLIPQMAGAGILLKLLFGIPYNVSVVLVGVGMIVYVAVGGMLATSWVQIIKAVLMLGAGAIVLFLALAGVGFDPLTLFASAEQKAGPSFLLPGNLLKNPFDEISLGLGYMLWTRWAAACHDPILHCARCDHSATFGDLGSCFSPELSLLAQQSSAWLRFITSGQTRCVSATRAEI
jgi:cation/acetate symporter